MKKIKLAILTIVVSSALLSASASAFPGVKFPPATHQIALAN